MRVSRIEVDARGECDKLLQDSLVVKVPKSESMFTSKVPRICTGGIIGIIGCLCRCIDNIDSRVEKSVIDLKRQ